MSEPKLTPTHRRILTVLADGLAHSANELMVCMADKLSGEEVLHYHLSTLRRVLRLEGEEIRTEIQHYPARVVFYRHVRTIRKGD